MISEVFVFNRRLYTRENEFVHRRMKAKYGMDFFVKGPRRAPRTERRQKRAKLLSWKGKS